MTTLAFYLLCIEERVNIGYNTFLDVEQINFKYRVLLF